LIEISSNRFASLFFESPKTFVLDDLALSELLDCPDKLRAIVIWSSRTSY